MTDKNEIIINSINQLFKTVSNNYIFIYTPPKVGSTTLVSSLRISLGKSYNIIHIHDEVMLSVLTGINNITINEIVQYLANSGKKVYVIDVYRTPIERKISEFFEKISPYHFNNTEENINKYSMQRVSNRFNKLFPHLETGDHYFNKYNIPNPPLFDFSKKYTIQEFNNVNYVKLRLCDSQLWDKILSEIFVVDIVLVSDYKTEDKGICDLYNKFKNEYKLPTNYFEDIKNCRYFNFYYNEKERTNYLDSWKNKLTSDFVPYSLEEYKFYMQLCLENQYINDIQVNHYIDNGCFCTYCTKKRREIYYKIKCGEKINGKIIHSDIVQEEQQKVKKNILNIVNKKNASQKFKSNQFTINVNHK